MNPKFSGLFSKKMVKEFLQEEKVKKKKLRLGFFPLASRGKVCGFLPQIVKQILSFSQKEARVSIRDWNSHPEKCRNLDGIWVLRQESGQKSRILTGNLNGFRVWVKVKGN